VDDRSAGLGPFTYNAAPLPHPAEILSAAGPIARALAQRQLAFEARTEQLEMAAAVAATMDARSHLLVEAGTGVGKSFAYLVPAILRACLHRQRVVIATNTIALQEQLVEKDIPLLQAALEEAGIIPAGQTTTAQRDSAPATPSPSHRLTVSPSQPPTAPPRAAPAHLPLSPVLVKGRGNYISVRRLAQASKRQERLFADAAARRTLHIIEDWALDTRDGTLSTLPPLERIGVWDKVQSDSANCMGRNCPQYRRCFYQNARRRMEQANLLICNHALFFSDLALRAKDVGFLPDYQHIVLDEAHNVEDVAAEHFGISLSEGRVMHLLGTLYHGRTGRGYLPQLQLALGDAAAIDAAVRLVLAADNAARAFFDSLHQYQKRDPARSGRIRRPGIVDNTLTPAMKELALRLTALREALPATRSDGEGPAPPNPDRYELNAYIQRAAAIASDAEALINQEAEGCAYWVEVSGGEDDDYRRATRITLACSPVEVGPILKQKLFEADTSVILTSATLAAGAPTSRGSAPVEQAESQQGSKTPGHQGAFAHIMSRLGCENAAALQLGSPFDHAAQVELYIERSMPRPGSTRPRTPPADDFDQRNPFEDGIAVRTAAPVRHDDSYEAALARRILHHIDQTDGGAFVLFTSFATLNRTADLLRQPLAERAMPLLAQGRDGPRTLILQKFRDDPRSVLLGAASFWQGVDVRGRGLRNVIITRLPFEPPDRPLTEARLERISERGGDPFIDDSLPRAIIRFKQGFGRLIRSHTDSGRVVVLDPRILTTGYGRRFLDALPKGVRVMEV
jgi:ATP-dependent DNA helicase DinG